MPIFTWNLPPPPPCACLLTRADKQPPPRRGGNSATLSSSNRPRSAITPTPMRTCLVCLTRGESARRGQRSLTSCQLSSSPIRPVRRTRRMRPATKAMPRVRRDAGEASCLLRRGSRGKGGARATRQSARRSTGYRGTWTRGWRQRSGSMLGVRSMRC